MGAVNGDSVSETVRQALSRRPECLRAIRGRLSNPRYGGINYVRPFATELMVVVGKQSICVIDVVSRNQSVEPFDRELDIDIAIATTKYP